MNGIICCICMGGKTKSISPSEYVVCISFFLSFPNGPRASLRSLIHNELKIDDGMNDDFMRCMEKKAFIILLIKGVVRIKNCSVELQ